MNAWAWQADLQFPAGRGMNIEISGHNITILWQHLGLTPALS
jgi:hypothetical protein